VNRGKHAPARKPADFHPFAKKKAARQATPEEIQKLLGPDWHKVKT
jgi:hypothetical protein